MRIYRLHAATPECPVLNWTLCSGRLIIFLLACALSPFQLFIDRLKISHWIWRYWFPFDTHFEQFHLFAHALMWLKQRRSTWAVHYYLFNDTTAAWGVFSSTSRDARDSKNTAPLSREVKSEDFSLSFYFILLRIHFSSFFMFHFPSKLSDAVECALLHSSFSTANRTGEELFLNLFLIPFLLMMMRWMSCMLHLPFGGEPLFWLQQSLSTKRSVFFYFYSHCGFFIVYRVSYLNSPKRLGEMTINKR